MSEVGVIECIMCGWKYEFGIDHNCKIVNKTLRKRVRALEAKLDKVDCESCWQDGYDEAKEIEIRLEDVFTLDELKLIRLALVQNLRGGYIKDARELGLRITSHQLGIKNKNPDTLEGTNDRG